MLPQEIIRRKRDGGTLTHDELAQFVRGLTSGAISEGQVSALAMAVFFRGMAVEETIGLTLAMRDSGTVLKWDLPGPVVDKHSSGGIGDNVSVMLAPMLAACGCYVPMISGRGLGHTGGTLDKLDSIPGYKTQPGLALFSAVVAETGAAIIGQTDELAPADKRFYGIRDVTATVESVPLITASILSKKLAAGLEQLVLDVKVGSGAFMVTLAEAQALAQSLVTVANGAGLKTSALITDMDEPLADAAGNAVEVQNAVDYLSGKRREPRLHEVTMGLGAELLALSGIAQGSEAFAQLQKALDSGEATERFQRMITALGGPADFMQNSEKYLPHAPIIRPVYATQSGPIERIETRNLGVAVIELGGGRRVATDKIDHAVGLTDLLPKGAEATRDKPLALIHARTEASFENARAIVQAAYHIGGAPEKIPAIIERIGATP